MPTDSLVSRLSLSAVRARPEWQFFGVLWKASPGKTRRLVVRPRAAGRDARPAGHRHGRGRGRGARRQRPHLAAHGGGRALRARAGAAAGSAGGQRGARRGHRRLAQRPVDAGQRRPAGHGPPGERGARHRPRDGPRLRPRSWRPAAADLDGVHRDRARSAGDRHRVGGHPLRLLVVGAAGAARRVGVHPLVAARERGVEGPQHRGGARRAAARCLRLRPGGRAAGCQGAAAVRSR